MTYVFDQLLTTCRKLSVFDYRTDMSIGAYDSERTQTQPVIFNVDVWVLKTDSSGTTLDAVYDYTLIPQAIDTVIAQGHIDLQETVVDQVADALLADPRVRAVRVASQKPLAYPNCRSIGVEIFKSQAS